MSMDEKTLQSLSQTLAALDNDAPRAIPSAALQALAPLVGAGLHLKIDLEASRVLGAPLVVLRQPRNDELLAPLTRRQKQVAQLMIAGRSNPEIGTELGISVPTVKDHVHAVLETLGFASRKCLMAVALGSGSDPKPRG